MRQEPPAGTHWRIVPIWPQRKPAMLRIVPVEGRPQETLLLYVDRQDERDRVVHFERLVEGQGLEEIMAYSDTRGVLNPVCVPVFKRSVAYVFIPDRGAQWPPVRVSFGWRPSR